jgi:hypothetical protein
MMMLIKCANDYEIRLGVYRYADKPWPFHCELTTAKQEELNKACKKAVEAAVLQVMGEPIPAEEIEPPAASEPSEKPKKPRRNRASRKAMIGS